MIKETLLSTPNPKGGFQTLPFIIANEAFERMASVGLMPNMILYLTREYGMETARGVNILFIWSAATNFMPVIGAFLADSYVGRYHMISCGSIASLLGMFLLWLTTIFPPARFPHCHELSKNCLSPTTSQLLLLYSSFGFMSIGAGGIRSSSIAFGADQLKSGRDNLNSDGILRCYFSWYYVSVSISAIISVTCIVYIQDKLGWRVGFGVPCMLMLLSAVLFFVASPFYVKLKAKESLLTGFAQVVAASYKNRHIELSSQATNEYYHYKKGAVFVKPTETLRFLNRACIIRNPQQDLAPEGRASDPWSICTIYQVEELKSLIKVIPLWSSGIMLCVTLGQSSIAVLQATTMDRHITPSFQIPAGSFSFFMIFTITIWITLYDRMIIPVASKIVGKPTYLGLKQRMGTGLIFSSSSMASLAIIETIRRKRAIEEGFSDDPQGVVKMSAMWLLAYHILSGLAEAFNVIGQIEFYYSELPKSMSSVASSLAGAGMSAASLVSSLILSFVEDATKRGGKESWVSSNINRGHYDWYFCLLSGLSLLNFAYFLSCCKAYGPLKEKAIRCALQ
ncbi:protein NRT1/ PTR FAMILY 1.2-like [Pistacia vera]|uniref:protein NRT1/ PTR FAMILY 1.2-like n=1 Tax=Pistacia vera TaxID=55513 RepID=UPI0012634315|nr:protein NRT1/ PTR FAMILY 1.2-like [Pistacia vera]